MTMEEIVRRLLRQAVADGLVREEPGRPPESLSSGDLVGVANLLAALTAATPKPADGT